MNTGLNNIINLKAELIDITTKNQFGIISDYTKANIANYVYSILKPLYEACFKK